MKKRISIIDILIIAVIILAVVVAFVYFSDTNMSKTSDTVVSFTVEIKSIPYENQQYIRVGDRFRDSIKGEYLGEVASVEYTESLTVRENTITGEFIETAFPDKCDAYITLKCSASIDAKTETISVANNDIKIGKAMYLRSKNFAGSGFIVDINKK